MTIQITQADEVHIKYIQGKIVTIEDVLNLTVDCDFSKQHYAIDIEQGVCKNYSSNCYIPNNWVEVSKCYQCPNLCEGKVLMPENYTLNCSPQIVYRNQTINKSKEEKEEFKISLLELVLGILCLISIIYSAIITSKKVRDDEIRKEAR